MKFNEKPLRIHCLLLFFAMGLMSANLPAQTLSRTDDEARETATTQDADESLKATQNMEPEKPRFGGHIGVVIPIIARGNNTTTTIADDFVIGFPFGLIVKTDSPVAFDFEFVPIINRSSNQDFRFLVHPGIIYGFKKKYAAGLRGAYEIGTGNYGFTPLVARSFKLKGRTNYFIEADFPVRWERQADSPRFASVGFAAHSGINF